MFAWLGFVHVFVLCHVVACAGSNLVVSAVYCSSVGCDLVVGGRAVKVQWGC